MNKEAAKFNNPTQYRKYFTYEDYENFSKGIHVELIDGVPYPWNGSKPVYDLADPIYMEGASQRHQEVSGELFVQFHTFLRGKPCKVFHAPFDMRLSPEKKRGNILEPDILVVCDKDKFNGKYCLGAPDLVIEIISPSTENKDTGIKLCKYTNAGVREIWIIEPEDKVVAVYVREGERHYVQHYINPKEIPVTVLEGLVINFEGVWDGDEGDGE